MTFLASIIILAITVFLGCDGARNPNVSPNGVWLGTEELLRNYRPITKLGTDPNVEPPTRRISFKGVDIGLWRNKHTHHPDACHVLGENLYPDQWYRMRHNYVHKAIYREGLAISVFISPENKVLSAKLLCDVGAYIPDESTYYIVYDNEDYRVNTYHGTEIPQTVELASGNHIPDKEYEREHGVVITPASILDVDFSIIRETIPKVKIIGAYLDLSRRG